MNIKEIINKLIDLDNENKELKYKIQRLEEKPNYKKLQKENIIDEIKEEYFIKGLEDVSSYYLEEVFNSAQIFNEDTRKFLDFNSWYSTITINESYRNYVFTKKTLNNLSNKEIIELYKPYLKKKYDKLIGDKRVELMNEAKEEKKKVKLKDLTLEQYKKWEDKNCLNMKCEDCNFYKVSCDDRKDDCWIKNKDLYNEKFLNQEIELEE